MRIKYITIMVNLLKKNTDNSCNLHKNVIKYETINGKYLFIF